MTHENRRLDPYEKSLIELEVGQVGAIIDLLSKVRTYFSQELTMEILAQKLTKAFTFSPETLEWALQQIDNDLEREKGFE